MRPPSPSDPPLRFVELGAAKFAYTDEGEGTALVALHGCPGSLRDFRWLAPALGNGIRLLRFDLPGFGDTPKAAFGDPTFSGRARLLVQLLDRLGVDQFAVLGHSAGGPLALKLAAMVPIRVIGLAQIAAPGLRPHGTFREHAWSRRLSVALEVPFIRRRLLAPLRVGFERSGFPRGLPDESIWQTMRVLRTFDFADQAANLARVRCSTLVAWAADDKFIEPEIIAEFASAAPNGPRLEFAEGGHYLQKTKSVEIGETLTTWLQNSESRRDLR